MVDHRVNKEARLDATVQCVNQSECSKQADCERSLRENNQQATEGIHPMRESKLKLMDYSPGHLNRSKSFFTLVTQSYLLCNLIPSYFLAWRLATPIVVGGRW